MRRKVSTTQNFISRSILCIQWWATKKLIKSYCNYCVISILSLYVVNLKKFWITINNQDAFCFAFLFFFQIFSTEIACFSAVIFSFLESLRCHLENSIVFGWIPDFILLLQRSISIVTRRVSNHLFFFWWQRKKRHLMMKCK
jgi:hypothetical protein